MKKVKAIVVAIAFLVAAFLMSAGPANAGHVGGPLSQRVTVPANQTVYLDLPFTGGDWAVVRVAGDGGSYIDLAITDGLGNVTTGAGLRDRKVARMTVYSPGVFRIAIHNSGVIATAVHLSTN